ncbi:NAD(P)H-dependent oxidoreductase subunit E [Candidatus Persebacteraceae bacterium Df01]|jgi:formate dehydrogenase|uniref:NADH-quinone oxidoreductase subunit F n=1 Tax=Candidatus Doriopsillibacter californiensis TaxID=2970740 RepID=A0ABT7QLI1_9GAMM|nr:NAD(P)H-dependent oxidoreductase subunit E [Candidatus Persebacteraceae bacterium Df01]
MSEEKIISVKRQNARIKTKGRIVSDVAMQRVREILNDAPLTAEYLIENLHRLQDAERCLTTDHMAALAALMNLPMAAVYEVATFYHHFHITDDSAPAVTVRVCRSLSCEMAGAGELMKSLQQALGERAQVIAAPCVGRCSCAPVAVAGQNAVERATVPQVISAVENGDTAPVIPAAQTFSDYQQQGGYDTYRRCVQGELTFEEVVRALEESHLRGLGGAGFPAARKWRIVGGEAGDKILAVNIDEGEPGTFKDRYYLERAPHQFLEGALIAAWAVTAADVYIYLRDEYHGCRLMLESELAILRASDIVLPRLHLRRGAGAYICGEESAMIESIEGKRGEPRLRPPYVAQEGVFNRPTLEHNMETLHWVPEILRRGAAWFADHGRRERHGLRSFSVSGRVNKPGVHIAPAGITVRELIDEYCGGMVSGQTLYGYLPGGASGGILPAALDNIPLDFDTVQAAAGDCFIGSAAIIVLSEKDCARDAALNMLQFFEDESCGQCTPCRVGTAKAAQLMQAPKWDAALLEELSQAMADASICGLGQAAPNPIRCVLKYFPHEVC